VAVAHRKYKKKNKIYPNLPPKHTKGD
jgi:hypothetical protein